MKRERATIEQVWLTAAELSEYFELSIQRVGQLRQMGVLQQRTDGLYDLTTSLIGYERFLAHGA